ncbi:hypothetical protein D3C84_331770 [compost metagenome]
MYLFEWLMFDGRKTVDYEALEKEADRQIDDDEKIPPIGVTQSVSEALYHNDSLYAYNSTYMDVRTPNDEKRGLITLIPGTGGALLIWMLSFTLYYTIRDFSVGYKGDSIPLDIFDYIFMWLIPAIPIVSLYLYFKYVFPYLRLEIFTARRLIVRFNRITRKVYLLRPKHLGGVVALDWDKTDVCINPDMSELDGTGGFVLLGWEKEYHAVSDADGNPKDDFEMTLVGKPTRNAAELLAFWEYIRRYMEDGPEAAPAPERLLPRFPWPWHSLSAVWRLDTGFIKTPALWIFIPVHLLLLPLILIHACAHWVSLLLCYEPRFPRSIANAGIHRKEK